MVYKLLIMRSSGCVYSNMYAMVEAELKKSVPELVVESVEVGHISGCFEAQMINDGKKAIVHSKLNGQGAVTRENLPRFIDKVKKFK
jgi:selT/selW/selH-like putative selenoprotein